MAEMWTDRDSDPRSFANPEGELATYREYLSNYRLTLAMKCDELSAEQLATRSVPPSTLSLLGLVRHSANVEQRWFQRALVGDLDERGPFHDDAGTADVDFDGAVGTQACVDEAFTSWQREIARADAHLDELTDADMGKVLPIDNEGGSASIRDILVHLVEEYARHCGHADLLRQCIDGRVGQ